MACLEEEIMSQRSLCGLKAVKGLVKILSQKKSNREVLDYCSLILTDYMMFLEVHGYMLSKVFYYITQSFPLGFQQEVYNLAYAKTSAPDLFPFLRQAAVLVQAPLTLKKCIGTLSKRLFIRSHPLMCCLAD